MQTITDYFLWLATVNSGLPGRPRGWPAPMSAEALHGPVSDFINTVGPHTEADEAALAIQFLAMAGNMLGRSAYFPVGDARHHVNLFTVIVGDTSKARKGTAWEHVKRIAREVDLDYQRRIVNGLSSGEGLIYAVRDPVTVQEAIRRNGRVTGYEAVIQDHGVDDKRLLVVEAEFVSVLKVASREGNTLSPVLRLAWDGDDLQILTKNSPARATAPHISIIGHITAPELKRSLTVTEQANGLANRFLWAMASRSKLIPTARSISCFDLAEVIIGLVSARDYAGSGGEMRRDPGAEQFWHEVYPALSAGSPGLLGAMIARAEAQVMRIACVYALLDCMSEVRLEHLCAALAVWKYCDESTTYLFGDALGDPVADELLRALRRNPGGMTRTQINHLFHRNRTASDIGRALLVLRKDGLVQSQIDDREGKAGRPAECWIATTTEGGQP